MKKAEVFLYSLFAVGIVLKLLKLPMHTVFILVTLLVTLIYYVICLVQKRNDLYATLTGLLTVLWLFCLLAVLKHFGFLKIVWLVSIFSSVTLLVLLYKNKKVISGNSLFCSLIIVITVFFRFSPASNTYYLTNIKFNYEIDMDYFSWDKYSWFLYNDGKEDEALQANQNAQTALDKCLQNPADGHASEYATFIKNHQLAIRDKTWKEYP